MRILTIGSSPYIFASDSKIHRDVILSLQESGHFVDSIVFNHDVMYFLPSETGPHYFSYGGKRICQLFPFLGQKGEIAAFSFETMKNSQPDVVITIGNYIDTDFIWSIKSIYPHLIKWIAIFPSGTDVINERHHLALSYADAILTTTETAGLAFKRANLKASVVPYGPLRSDLTLNDEQIDEFKVLSMAKNSQMSNVPAFLQGLAMAGLSGTLHTNIDDGGDYNVRLLIERYKLKDKISLPTKYVSVREGISEENLNNMYRNHQVIVDCSLQSTTALTMLEAMSTGCIPIGVGFGAVGEILRKMPDEFRFSLKYETFVGPNEETLAVVDVKELAVSLQNIKECYLADKKWFKSARDAAVEVSKIFHKEYLTLRLKEIVELTVASENFLAVDSY